MKRYLPFLIIILVGLATVGIASALYRSKMQAAAAAPPPALAASPVAATSPTPAGSPVAAASVTPPPDSAPDPDYVSHPPLVLAPETDSRGPHALGPADAPVTLEMYGDFQCPPCAGAATMIHGLQKQFAEKLRVEFHEFPLAMHQHALAAAMAAEAAGLQGRFWEMHDMLYQYQEIWSKADKVAGLFNAYAKSLGLDVTQFMRDTQNAQLRQRIQADGNSGAARGVKNTPTIFLNGKELRPPYNSKSLQESIETALAEGKKS